MTEPTNSKSWVYVFVCEPGPKESFLGLYDEEKSLNLIPVFRSKEDAEGCYLDLPRLKGKKYELQAVHVEEIQEAAQQGDFTVVLLDGDGKVIKE